MRTAVLAAALVLGLAGAGALSYAFVFRERTIDVRVRGVEKSVPEGSTVGEAEERFGLAPAAGDLLDVEGAVLRPGAYPGEVLVNGRPAAVETKLAAGDSLRVLNGQSRSEPTSVSFVPVPAGMPANPQFTLSRTPGRQEFVRGRISGKVVPSAFHPTGPSHTPTAVALTFDDGPSPFTPRILATLRRLHARATFFVVGQWVKQYPGFVRRELRAGMEVGSHSYSHPYLPPFDRQPHPRILREIRWGRAVLEGLGDTPSLFRPPGGSFSPYVIEAAGSYGERLVLWSVDPTDWRPGSTAKQITRRVLRAIRPGSIVILHDGGGDRSATLRALPHIVRGIRHRGLKLVPIDPHGPG